jgi:uncharacterized protein (TIGR02996 family)
MASHEQFLQAIIACPDEDTPRLIYADWLEEQGDSLRAEFIRLQVRAALESTPSEERLQLHRAARQIIENHQPELLAMFPRAFSTGKPSDWFRYIFRRGFVEEMLVRSGRDKDHAVRLFVKRAREIFDVTPLRHFTFEPVVTPTQLQQLFQLPQTNRLETLDLRYQRCDEAFFRTLIDTPYLQNLKLLLLGEVAWKNSNYGERYDVNRSVLKDLERKYGKALRYSYSPLT